jgi:long-subunit acyl-CoA synthetase (AMP-forming)
MYTSGTTGKPKAVFLSAGRWIMTARTVALHLGLKRGDKMYTCLPLYHGSDDLRWLGYGFGKEVLAPNLLA